MAIQRNFVPVGRIKYGAVINVKKVAVDGLNTSDFPCNMIVAGVGLIVIAANRASFQYARSE